MAEASEVPVYTDDTQAIVQMEPRSRPAIPWQVEDQFNADNNIVIYSSTVAERYSITYKSELWINNGNDESVGYFSMYGNGFFNEKPRPPWWQGSVLPMSLSIYIEDEYNGNGYSIYLIDALCKYILATQGNGQIDTFKKEEIINNSILVIDTDASEGFWERIGMITNRHVNSTKNSASGYERTVLFNGLHMNVSKIIDERKGMAGGYTKQRYKIKRHRTNKYKNRKSQRKRRASLSRKYKQTRR